MNTLHILQPGMLSTVQDLGRPHLRQSGLPTGGAMDAPALRIANLLVGNPENTAAIECALVGPVIEFQKSAVVAIAGARVDGVPYCERFRMKAKSRLDLTRFVAGAYAYVAVAGGVDVPTVLGGHGTDVKLKFGGHHGRPLRAGDVLPIGKTATSKSETPLRVSPITDPLAPGPIRFVDGKDAGAVAHDWCDATFTVSSQSDRMGVRLDGPAMNATAPAAAASAVVLPGTIQLPPDGRPIAVLADAQTLGGYPQIAHVITADLPRLAQIRPGQTVRFERVSLADAHQLLRQQTRQLALLRQGIRFKLGTA